MIHEIGVTAGDIWRYLEANGTTSLSQLKVKLDQPENLIIMGIGWLAREEKVVIEKSGRGYAVALRQ
ncbi:MAG: winged helix-turn-helix domain-containing protein [Candidatus Latescibacteria bacterium]|nr:winged helix-turn-helix domain-containing protein [Candidatus Latescibacterota bacterium]